MKKKKKKKPFLVTLLKWPPTLIFSYLPTALPLMIVIEFMANGSLDNFLKVSLPAFAIWLLMIVVSWNYRLLTGIIKDVVA